LQIKNDYHKITLYPEKSEIQGRFMRNLTFSTIVGFGFLMFSSNIQAFEIFNEGESAKVACKSVKVMDAPSSFARQLDKKKFGDSIKIETLERVFELPDSNFSSKKKLEEQAKQMARGENEPKKIEKSEYTRAAWVGLGKGKYISASCIVSEKNFSDQTIEKAEEKIASFASDKAKRNFSEDEGGDMRAMRGAAGGATGGKANFNLIDILITGSQGKVSVESLTEFRRSGRLGEFK
jgi:hypothetical protein